MRVYAPEWPSANKDGYVLEHRYVYEKSRGVTLSSGMAIHHINGDKLDNRPDNLIAFANSEHRKAHVLAREIASLFIDRHLYEAARAEFMATGQLPDLEQLTRTLYLASSESEATPPKHEASL